MKTLNEDFMESSKLLSEAMGGLMTLTKITISPGTALYRFADARYSDRFCSRPWWISFSPYEALKQYAKFKEMPLQNAARKCLAIGQWNNADTIVKVSVKEPLSAWSGTPKTLSLKQDTKKYIGKEHIVLPGAFNNPPIKEDKEKYSSKYLGVNLMPERNITQLFIPGLDQIDPNDSKRKIWQSAFLGPWVLYFA